jgi:single-strand DNA-binding protein
MARGVNKVILIGNLGADPESRSFDNGGTITNISIGTSESWNDRQTGERQERTECHRIVFNNKLAEIAAQYLRKGSKVYIEGSLRTRKWQDAQGVDRYTTEIRANEMQMLDSRGQNDGSMSHNMGGGYSNNVPQQNYQGSGGNGGFSAPQRQSAPAPAPQAKPQFSEDFDDDIPF